MPISAIHSYLVRPPAKDGTAVTIRGTSIPQTGHLFKMLSDVYDSAEKECSIEIAFTPNGGDQQNPCRDLLIGYLKKPGIVTGRTLAERLGTVTTHRSGMGLLFALAGQVGDKHKVMISRFPADNGISAEESDEALKVSFIEKVFMKSATAYKAVVYTGSCFDSHFWDGHAVDKQINNNGMVSISNYWIKDFLASDFRTTSAAGTKRLGLALKNAMRATKDIAIKNEIAAVTQLAGGLNKKTISIQSFAKRFNLSQETQAAIRAQFRNEQLLTERFTFSKDEFAKHIAFQSVKLDNGATLTAEATQFDDVIRSEQVAGVDGHMRFSTEGRVVDRRLRTSQL